MAEALRRKQAIIEWGLAIPLAVTFAAVVTGWALVFDRQPPFDLQGGNITPPAVREFEKFEVRWKQRRILRAGDYEAKCDRMIIDSVGTVHTIDMPPAATTDVDFNPRVVHVPRGASWGPATWRIDCCYQMKRLSLTQLWPTCVRRPELRLTILPPMK